MRTDEANLGKHFISIYGTSKSYTFSLKKKTFTVGLLTLKHNGGDSLTTLSTKSE